MERNNSHLAGEYFVAAELYRRSFSVAMTIGNAKAIDILVQKDGKQTAVQVKAMQNKSSNFPIGNGVEQGVVYVFVNLNCNEDGFLPPDYYICTAEEVEQIAKKYPSQSVVYLPALREGGFQDKWGKLE